MFRRANTKLRNWRFRKIVTFLLNDEGWQLGVACFGVGSVHGMPLMSVSKQEAS